jgi:hypothetical protein
MHACMHISEHVACTNSKIMGQSVTNTSDEDRASEWVSERPKRPWNVSNPALYACLSVLDDAWNSKKWNLHSKLAIAAARKHTKNSFIREKRGSEADKKRENAIRELTMMMVAEKWVYGGVRLKTGWLQVLPFTHTWIFEQAALNMRDLFSYKK